MTGTERLNLDTDQPSEVFADVPARTIRGLAIPLGSTAVKAGRTWRFQRNSVKFTGRTPLLQHHDVTKPIGRLTRSAWSERGLEVEFSVSRTVAGDEALQLAQDGVLALSVGIDVPLGGARQVGEELHVTNAQAAEVSLTPIPAFAGSVIDHVALTGDTPEGTPGMPDTDPAPTQPITINLDAQALGQAIGAAMTPLPVEPGPVPQPVPAGAVVTAEPPPYRFNGVAGQHSFVRDAFNGYGQNDAEARNRIERFLSETFVATTDAAALTPVGHRPDLYVDSRPPLRVLGGLISGGTLDAITPFVVPRFNSASNLVNDHVEMVEPTLATFTAADSTIDPKALSGKAAISRELADQASPQIDQMIWSKMVNASVVAAEARIAAMLDAFVDASPLALSGVDATLADDLDTTLLGVTEMERYGVLAATPALYAALATARDSTGRKLFPAYAPSNADGTATGRRSLDLNGLTAVQANGLTNSYLIEKGAVYQWLSAPRQLLFSIEVRTSVYIGFWQYSAEAIIDDAGVRRVTYAA